MKDSDPRPRFWYIRTDIETQKIPKHETIPAGGHLGIICVAYRATDLGLRLGFGFCSPLSNFTRLQGRRYAEGRFRRYPIMITLNENEHPKEVIRSLLEHIISCKELPPSTIEAHPKAVKRFPVHFPWFNSFQFPEFEKIANVG